MRLIFENLYCLKILNELYIYKHRETFFEIFATLNVTFEYVKYKYVTRLNDINTYILSSKL